MPPEVGPELLIVLERRKICSHYCHLKVLIFILIVIFTELSDNMLLNSRFISGTFLLHSSTIHNEFFTETCLFWKKKSYNLYFLLL
jgi:hypothetical protein